MTVLVLMGHGSPDFAGQRELLALRARLAARLPFEVRLGVSEFSGPGAPDLESAFTGLSPRTRVVAQPLLLFSGGHWRDDIPPRARRMALDLDLDLCLGRPIGDDPVLIGLVESRLRAVGAAGGDALLFVGRGSADARARTQTQQVAAGLARRLGIVHEVCYAGISHPDVAEGMALVGRRHPSRILVVPYLLHAGALLRRVQGLASQSYVGCPALVSAHIGNSEPVVDMLVHRAMAMRDRVPAVIGL